MLDPAELERRIMAMADTVYPPGTIREVHCRRDLDHVNEPVVWVGFVVADGVMPFDPHRQLDFGLQLSRAFADWDDPAYPVTSFYPETEYRGLYPAAA